MTTDLDTWDETESSGVVLAAQAESLVIKDHATYERAGLFRAGVKAFIEEIKARCKPKKEEKDREHKAEVAKERSLLQAPLYALDRVNKLITDYERQVARD